MWGQVSGSGIRGEHMRLGRVMVFVFIVLGLSVSTTFAKTATVNIEPTKDGSSVSGTVRLEEVSGGLRVDADVKGVPLGKHGFHIHENDACADEGKAAGGHFNPDHVSHGLLSKDGFSHAHAGDLGNIEVGADGTGKLATTLRGLSLSEGKYNVAGKSIILHEKEDDFGQPTGNAGGRIGCGVIPAIFAVTSSQRPSPIHWATGK